jgi:hypothetical protein
MLQSASSESAGHAAPSFLFSWVTVRVRDFFPDVRLQAENSVQPLTAQSMLHAFVSERGGHTVPLFLAVCVTVRVRVCCPDVMSQVEKSVQPLT